MKVIQSQPNKDLNLIAGNLYKNLVTGEIYLCTSDSYLISVTSGLTWNSVRGGIGVSSSTSWEDVTHRFTLVEYYEDGN